MSNNNNKVILRLRDADEENNPGHEIILRSLPNENEVPSAASNRHPEEEPDADEDEQPFSYGRWRPAWSRSRALTAFLAAAGVGVVVGTASVVFRAAGGKPSTTITSNKQVANVVSAPTGYEQVGNVNDGFCADGSSQFYPNVQYYGPATASVSDCATKCNANACVAGDFPFVGLAHSTDSQGCVCFVSQTVPNVDLSQINNIGGCRYSRQSSSDSGTGTIAGTKSMGGGWTCYRYVGGGSKAGKTPKAPKRG